MKRLACLLLLLAAPQGVTAQQADAQVLQDMAVEALAEYRHTEVIRGLMFAGVERSGDAVRLCATSNAVNQSGHFVGLTYWSVILRVDGSEVVSVHNVTGLLHDCYGGRYAPYKPPRD